MMRMGFEPRLSDTKADPNSRPGSTIMHTFIMMVLGKICNELCIIISNAKLFSSFIQQTLTEHLLPARHWTRSWGHRCGSTLSMIKGTIFSLQTSPVCPVSVKFTRCHTLPKRQFHFLKWILWFISLPWVSSLIARWAVQSSVCWALLSVLLSLPSLLHMAS